jgi:hypothetical protein
MNTRTSTFAGTWRGFYSYGGPGNIYDFTLTIDSTQSESITGTILEKDHAEPIEISGFLHPPVVRFYKVGVNKKSVRYFEPVEFQGFMSSDGLNVSGSWTNASAHGDWSAQKDEVSADSKPEKDQPQSDVDIDAVMKAPAYENAARAPVDNREELVPRDAPVESWDPEEPTPAGGLAASFKSQIQEHSVSNVHSFFTVDPIQGEPDLAKPAQRADKGYVALPPPLPTDEKSDESGSFVEASVANNSAFQIDPGQDEPDKIRQMIEAGKSKKVSYTGTAPPVTELEKEFDAGSFIDKSEANKSPFQVDPIAGEPEPDKAPSFGQSRYAADTDYDPLDYGIDKKDTANSAMVHNPDANHSAYTVDPIGNELDLLGKSGNQLVSQADAESAENSASQLVHQIDDKISGDLQASVPDLSGITSALPASPIFNTEAVQPQQAVPSPPTIPVTPPPPSATILPELGTSTGPPLPQLNSNSSTTCPRCGADRGAFSFCMSCGHSFDLTV